MNNAVSFYPWRRLNSIPLPHQPSANVIITTSNQVTTLISKQGNRRVRALLIEMSWMWLRHQPHSALSRWFAQRTQGTGANKRSRRISIVAVARRLVIALWRYLKDGVIPEGAQIKAA